MAADGNCLFRAVAHQVLGDAAFHRDLRHLCLDYMVGVWGMVGVWVCVGGWKVWWVCAGGGWVRLQPPAPLCRDEKERDHFSQFVTESFSAYCKRKRRDKVHGNNLELQALAELFNRPIHIFCYSTEPVNIFQTAYDSSLPPIRLSYHRRRHYNSLVNPSQPNTGVGLGLSALQPPSLHLHLTAPQQGGQVPPSAVKQAMQEQQDAVVEQALVCEAQACSDRQLTEEALELAVMEASYREYVQRQQQQQQQQQRGVAVYSPGYVRPLRPVPFHPPPAPSALTAPAARTFILSSSSELQFPSSSSSSSSSLRPSAAAACGKCLVLAAW
ncbi:unnamed protein product [Closterium sp. Naga37s-1]|nr:unnamed protein product [Closterium sp. Naga37s-1]